MLKIEKGSGYECPGIYAIICFGSCKIYVGSTKDLYQRISAHKYTLELNKHINPYLQNAYNKYGKDSFEYYVIEFCRKKELFEREQFYVNLYKSHYSLYGFNLRSVEPGNLGYSFTSEQKKKVSEGVKRKLQNKEYLKKRQDKIAEYARSKEGRKQRSETTKETWRNEETRQKRVEGLYASGVYENREVSQETKEKLSQSGIKYWANEENRQKMSESKKQLYIENPEVKQRISEMTTKAMNKEEVKIKVSQAQKKRFSNEEERARMTELRKQAISTDVHKQKLSVVAKELWNTEEYRIKMCKERKERFDKQENKDKMSEISNKMWKNPSMCQQTLLKRSNLTQEQFEKLKEFHKLNYNNMQIANILGCKRSTVARIRRGESKLFQLS